MIGNVFENTPVLLPSDKSLQSVKFSSNDIIIVANSDLVRMNGVSVENITQSWVARVVEIRAKDKAHVYVLVQWLYWPNELPSGRQLYHSKYELVGSNHLDVIEATTVSCKWPVTAWAEDEDDYVLSNGDDSSSSQVRGLYGLFWRQTYNVYNHKLSTLRKYCLCQQYHNPDHPLIKCENPTCDLWLHGKCIIRCAIDQKHTEMLESDNDYRKRTDKIDGKGWGKLLYGNLISSSDQGPRQKFHTTIRDLRLHDKDFTADSNEQGFWHEQARCPNCDSLIP
ncbi:MAG: hypothetical protein M1814_000180 [Vezdaea aestivalis]|nr:MAG: hypothetical protein M1814_000180 [Vezdaea aestivalis]